MNFDELVDILTGKNKITAFRIAKFRRLEFWWVKNRAYRNFPLGRKHLLGKRLFWKRKWEN